MSDLAEDPCYREISQLLGPGSEVAIMEVIWEPDNGSSYHVAFTRLRTGWLVSLVNWNCCMVISNDGTKIDWEYVMAKLKFDNWNDSAHVARLIGEILERPFTPVAEVLA